MELVRESQPSKESCNATLDVLLEFLVERLQSGALDDQRIPGVDEFISWMRDRMMV